MNAWWNSLNDRERWLVGGGGLALVILLLYLLVWEPFQQQRQLLRQNVAALRADLDWMRQAAAEVQRLQAEPQRQARPGGPRPSLLILADQTARQAQLGQALKRVEPQGSDKLRVWLEGAPFDVLVGWLNTLQQQGVQADNAVITPSRESGKVDARLTLAEVGA